MKKQILNTAKRLLQTSPQDYDDCGEVVCGKLAEDTAHELDHDEWLDDELHYVWDAACLAADWWKKEGE